MASPKLTTAEVVGVVAEITALIAVYVGVLSYTAVWMSSQLQVIKGILMG
jgi:hypothetical protein